MVFLHDFVWVYSVFIQFLESVGMYVLPYLRSL